MKILIVLLHITFFSFSALATKQEPLINQDYRSKGLNHDKNKQILIYPPQIKELPILKEAKENSIDKDSFDSEEVFNIQAHRPTYAIFGEPDAKFQLSFKYQLVKDFKLFLGYTQTIFWDLASESRPFNDANYSPELFYNYKLKNSYFKNLQIGYDHKSNGKAGSDSRSYDSAYLNFMSIDKLTYGLSRLEIKLRYLLRLDETNLDIRRFYGPFVVKCFFKNIGHRLFKSEELFIEYYMGDSFKNIVDRSSFRISLRFKIFKTKTAPKLFLQYFNGYGENLANYDQKVETFRLGLSIGGE